MSVQNLLKVFFGKSERVLLVHHLSSTRGRGVVVRQNGWVGVAKARVGMGVRGISGGKSEGCSSSAVAGKIVRGCGVAIPRSVHSWFQICECVKNTALAFTSADLNNIKRRQRSIRCDLDYPNNIKRMQRSIRCDLDYPNYLEPGKNVRIIEVAY